MLRRQCPAADVGCSLQRTEGISRPLKTKCCCPLRPPLPNPAAGSVFFHYDTRFDAEAVIRRHAVPDFQARPGYLPNFLGVLIEPRFVTADLEERVGEVEGPPILANWHADIAEWAAALPAVDLARGDFTMLEFGCGWGCWMCNTGVAARGAALASGFSALKPTPVT